MIAHFNDAENCVLKRVCCANSLDEVGKFAGASVSAFDNEGDGDEAMLPLAFALEFGGRRLPSPAINSFGGRTSITMKERTRSS